MKPYTLSFEIEDLPELPNKFNWSHWTAKRNHNKKWGSLVRICVGRKQPKTPLERAHVTLTRVSVRRPDFDGLVGSFKAVLDGLVYANVLLDDTHDVIGIPTYLWEKGKPKQGFIKVEVKEIIGEVAC